MALDAYQKEWFWLCVTIISRKICHLTIFTYEFYLAIYSITQTCLILLKKASPFGKAMAGFMGYSTLRFPFNNTAGKVSCPFVLLVSTAHTANPICLLTSWSSSNYVILSIPSTLIRLGLYTTGYDPRGMKSFTKLKAEFKKEILIHSYAVSIWYPQGWPMNSSSCWLKVNVSLWV